MKTRPLLPSARLSQQALELSFAAPQVIARRVARMAMAGAQPSALDHKELREMSDEKFTAFYESWAAMWAQMFKSQLAIAQAMSTAVTTAVVAGKAVSPASTINAMTREANKVMSAGMAPVHKKAMDNAKRLAGLK